MKPTFINDADYKVEIRETFSNKRTKVLWRCPIYSKWDKMKTRCRNSSENINPTYLDKTICDEWYTFSNFHNWISTLPFDEKYIKDLELDKDIKFPGNLIYSPETCLMVPKYVNNSVLDLKTKRGIYPLGVTYDPTPRLKANLRASIKSKFFTNHSLGRFHDPMDAHREWQKAKIKHFEFILLDYSKEPFYYKDVDDALTRIITKLKYEHDNNIETIRVL